MHFTAAFNYTIYVLFLFCVTMCSCESTRAESVGYCVVISIVCMCVVHRQVQFWTFHLGRIICVLVMIVRLEQNTKHEKDKRYMNSKTNHQMNLLWLCFILISPVVCEFRLLHNTYVMLEHSGKGPRFIVQSWSSSYFCNYKRHTCPYMDYLIQNFLVYLTTKRINTLKHLSWNIFNYGKQYTSNAQLLVIVTPNSDTRLNTTKLF